MTGAGSSARPPADGGPFFEDGKSAGAMRTIGEVSAALKIKPHVLRYWESKFPELSPLKRSGGRRLYRPEDVAMVERIDRLVNREGFTLKGAKKALANGQASSAAPKDAPPKELATRDGATRDGAARDGAARDGATGNTEQPLDRAELTCELRAIRDRLSAALRS